MKHVIIGGVAGGATAAARIRRADENAEIILLEKGKYISYANCGLPYYIGGIILDRDKLFVQTPETFARRFNIGVRTEQEAVGIDTEAKTVEVRGADGTVYRESYDKLLLSPGSSPVRPPLEGIHEEGVFTLRNVTDTDAIKAYIDTHKVRSTVVIGGGFIGLEMAENIYNIGSQVDIVELAPQVMAPVDFSIASHVHRELMNKGVGLHLGKGVNRFERVEGRLRVFLSSGETLDTDMVLLSIGVRPNVELAQRAGIALGQRGIKVDEYLSTSAKDVYAVGDAIEYPHPETGEAWMNFLAGPANRQARIAADNMVFGNSSKYEGAIGTSIAKVFDLTVGTTGLPAKRLQQLGMAYQSSTTASASHAGYYPNSFQLTLKLTFDPKTGKLYGAQCVGHEGVDKRIDEIALVIKQGGTVADLTRLEQAYAPPYSSAKDPVAIAGYAASNIISGAMPVVYWRDIEQLDITDTLLIDVRTPEEYALGTIEGAVNIPLDDLRMRLGEIPDDKKLILFCQVGLRGYLAQRILLGRGYKEVFNLSGGYRTYHLATQKIIETATPNKLSACRPSEAEQPAGPSAGSPSQSTVPHSGTSALTIDACGLSCPGPIMKMKEAVDALAVGEQLEVRATDPGFPRDAEAWCQSTGNRLLASTSNNGIHSIIVERGLAMPDAPAAGQGGAENKTLILFSSDLDRAIATFILANGAAATGKKTSIFFTFWGLNVIKKQQKPAIKKDFISRMFGWMLPKSSRSLRLSHMSFFGIGDRLIRYLMKRDNVGQLEDLILQAQRNGVEFIACQMTMDMMGIHKEELLDGVTIGGVATYMQRAEQARVNLFI